MKKYLCIGGFVSSADGDEHKIRSTMLPALYRVNPAECIFVEDVEHLGGYRFLNLIELHPDGSGRYEITEQGE